MNYMYTTTPLDLISEKREELSKKYRDIISKKIPTRGEVESMYWLSIWIQEYDNTIKALKRRNKTGEIDGNEGN